VALKHHGEALGWVLFLATVATAVGSVLIAPRPARALTRLGVGLAFAMVLVAVGLAAARRAFLDAVGGALPSTVARSLYDTVVASMQAGFRSIFGLGLLIAVLVVIAGQPGFASRWARPTQAVVGSLGVLAVLVRDAPPTSYVVFVLSLAATTIGLLEVVRRRRLAGGEGADRVRPTVAG
jgi:hypothetical protein